MARGLSVALIGTDGAGKSTVAHIVSRAQGRKTRVIYMGLNPSRATTRVSLSHIANRIVTHPEPDFRGGRKDTHGRLWAAIRLVYRIAEETLRFANVAWHRFRGDLVLMDRHFRYDHVLDDDPEERLSERIHHWYLERLTPEPDLVIFLDVPASVAIRRSGEGSLAYHERRQKAWIRYAETRSNVIRIDADRALDDVVGDVMGAIRDASAEG